jgi:methylated-DNA-[protein]-cysteine S-methyltransferase
MNLKPKYKDHNFSKKVYDIVKTIPRGEAWTYKKVASRTGHPGAYRAVGTILSKNTDPSIPCHRVIRSNGKIGEYNGIRGEKARLLKEEGVII